MTNTAIKVERIFGNGYATSCSGVTATGANCKRNTFHTYNGQALCSSHVEQATAERADNITPEQAEALYAEYGIA